jgi:hypothetical protein
MKNTALYSAVMALAVVAASPGACKAQTQSPSSQEAKDTKTSSAAKPAQKNTLDGILPKWLRIGASIRGRFEDGIVGTRQDTYYLNRVRLDVSVLPTSWLNFFVQVQDTRVWGYDLGQPAGSLQNPFDLRQAYVMVGGGESSGQWIRFGRQEIQYGAGRIFSTGDWSNTAKSFDVVRGSFYRPGVKLDFIAGSPVLIDPTRFDRHKPGEHIYGTYDAFDKLVPGGSIEPYFFTKTQLGVAGELGSKGDATEFITGVRFAGNTPGRIDYSFELLHQNGSYAKDPISALGGTYTLGWTLSNSAWKPRVSADYSHASGDDNPKDGTHRTFDLLYGSNQPFYSLTGLFGWKNIRTSRLGVDFAPLKNMKVLIDYRDFNLATVQDGLYNSSGTRIFLDRKATSGHVGEGLDAQLVYLWKGGVTTGFGIGSVFSGAYLQEVGQKGDYLDPYFMWSKRF